MKRRARLRRTRGCLRTGECAMKKILSAALMAALLLSVSAGALAATGLGSVTEVTNTAP